jgi:sporulation and spore germination protein
MQARRLFMLLLTALAVIAAAVSPPSARADLLVAEPFRDYYAKHAGMRVLGPPITGLVIVGGIAAQYFEKGRIEDHRAEQADLAWGFMYGRLTAELIERDPSGLVNGTGMTYAILREASAPEHRHAPPIGFTGGTIVIPSAIDLPAMAGEGVFVPYDAQLRAAAGYYVPRLFWSYITRRDYFPGGWLHDIGLPITDPLTVETYKAGELRKITMQAFERTVLTYDPQNPPAWQVERGNLGSDMLRAGGPTTVTEIERPAMGDRVTFPFPLVARVGRPGDQVTATISWGQGPQFINTFTVLPSERPGDQRGLVIGLLDWVSAQDPPPTARAVVELRNGARELLAWREVLILGPGDPDTRVLDLYWLFGEQVRPHPQRILATERIGAAALEALLWGPPRTQIGFTTALPTPSEVLAYPGRDAGWGARVTLRGLTIENGVATADFSQELRAYGGGSARVSAIREQITRTLKQFPSVREVRIAIEGQTEGVLEP